jgi:putative ABC transport system permease protein
VKPEGSAAPPDIDDEIAFHLEMRARELVAEGFSEQQAQVEARLRFGDLDAVRTECGRIYRKRNEHMRKTAHLEELSRDVAYSIRQLVASPGFAIVAILTLGLGIGATTSIFSVVRAVVLKPLPFREPERIALVGEAFQGLGPSNVSVGNFVDWRKGGSDVFERLAALDYENFNIGDTDEPARVLGGRVSRGFFELLGMPPLLGRWFHEEEDRPGSERVAILSYRLWARRYGADPHILGREIRLNTIPHTVVGVMPKEFGHPADDQELWTPVAFTPEEEALHDDHYLDVFGRLRAGVTYEAAQAKMDAVSAELQKLYPNDVSGIKIVSYGRWLVGDYRQRLFVMLGAVGLVLLIACSNVANLLLARGTSRAREMAVRAALGAGTARLARQVLVETLVLALGGAALGTAIAYWTTETLVASAPPGVPRLDETSLDPTVLAFALGLALVSSLVSGLAPALGAARTETPALRGEHRAGGTRSQGRVRSILVGAETALALTLLVGAGLLVRSALEMQRVPPGFDPHGVLTARVTLPKDAYPDAGSVVSTFERIVERAASVPSVRHASVSSQVPMGPGGGSNGLVPEGKSLDDLVISRLRMVTPDYFATMGIPLVEGRLFEPTDVRDHDLVMVVSESLARAAWPGESALGKRMDCCEGGRDHPMLKTVVGVVRDVHSRGLGAAVEPEFYLPIRQAPPEAWEWVQRSMTLAVKADRAPEALVGSLRECLRDVDSSLPLYGIATMDERVSDSLAQPRFLATLLGAMSVIGLVLAAVGVYGVIGYVVARRAHEIGVRMALGARSGDVISLIVRQAMRPVLVGMAVGLAAALAGAGVLESQLFGIRATDPWTFLSVACVLAVVAFIASYLPARRVARVDPKRALFSP